MQKKGGGGVTGVLVAATSTLRRGGLEALVREHPALKLLGSVPGIANLAARARELQPDVIIADLPSLDSQFIVMVGSLEAEEDVPIVGLIDEPDAGWAARALKSGVRALLPRESSAEEILLAIQAAVGGLVLLEHGTVKELVKYAPSGEETGAEIHEELSPREVEVLRLMAEGFGNKEIATRLGISDHTVKFHISSILAKLGASSRTEAATVGIRMGLVLL
jgi:two-component system, NarL family, response regulator YdfI